jgi:putative aldouronate transport system substrate-binding protein
MIRTFRIIARAAAVVLTVGLVAGCGLFKEGGSSSAGSAKTYDTALSKTWPEFKKHNEARTVCFEMGWTGPDAAKDFITPEIEKRTNFLFKYEPMTVATQDDLNQKLNLMVASKDVPDIYFGSTDAYSYSIYRKLGDTGVIWDIGPVIKDYKNIYELVKPELTLLKTREKKANYWVPTQTGRGNDLINNMPAGLFVRDDLLKKLKMDYPTTPDEFYTYLKRCKDEIKKINGRPVIGYTADENFSYFLDTFVAPFLPLRKTDGSVPGGLTWDTHNNYKVVNYLYTDSPELMRAAKYMNKLYREGLVDKEIITHKRAQFQEKVSSGRVASMACPAWDMNTFSDNAKALVPDIFYVANPYVYDKADGVPTYPDDTWTNWVGSYSALTVSKKVSKETLKHFLAALDYFATKDGQMLVQVGIQDKNYTLDEKGKFMFTDQFKKDTANLDWNKGASYGVFYYQQFVFNLPAYADLRSEMTELQRPDNRKGWENRAPVRAHYDPKMKLTKDYYFLVGDVENQKMPAIDSARQELWAKLLVAKSDAEVEKLVHDWAKTCKDMGIDDVIKERQDYMDTFDVGNQK